MEKSTWKFILSIVAVALMLFCTWAIVTALDLVRSNMEEMNRSLKEINDTLTAMSTNGGFAVARSEAPAAQTLDVANRKYYDPAAESGGRIINASGADAGNLNPVTSCDSTVSTFWSHAMDTLADTDYNNPDDFRPMLAESWKLSDDKLTWHIKLRKGVLWHDFTDPVTGKEWKNKEVTAHDFKFYLDVIKDEKVDAVPLRGYFAQIKEIRVIDDYTFDVVWSKPYFLSKDITLGLMPLARHLYNADGKFDGAKFNDDAQRNKMIIGCGPYQFVSWEIGKRVVFKRFEKYYGKRLGIMPPIRQISYDIYKHPGPRLQALEAKELDALNLTPEQWRNNTKSAAFAPEGHLKKLQYPARAYNYIGLNLTNPVFADKRVRQALSHLVDRERILRDVYYGLARAVSGPFFPDSSACDKKIKPREFSVEKAKKLLAEAGWRDTDGDGILDKDGKPLRFTIMNPNVNTTYQKILPILKEDMAKAGVQMEALSLEWSVVLQRLEKRHFDACMIAWTSSMRPDPYQLWHSDHVGKPATSNFISFRNKEADALIDAIRVEFDDATRQVLYHKFHQLIHEETPYLFLFSPMNLVAVSKRYRNLRMFPGGFPERILWTPAKEQRVVPGI